LSSYISRSTICLLVILLFGCAHNVTEHDTEPSPTADLSLAAEPPSAKIDPIRPVPPPPPMSVLNGNHHSIDDTELDSPQPVDQTSAEIAVDSTETVDTASLEPTSASNGIQQQLDEALDFCEAAQEFWQKGELENALESLDRAYSLILTVEPDDPAKLVQQKEDLRFLISKRILEIYASRNIVVNGNHNAIPREINANIQREINLFTKGARNVFLSSLTNVPANTAL
jgi:membrane-bound lytic murein transglycosylase D